MSTSTSLLVLLLMGTSLPYVLFVILRGTFDALLELCRIQIDQPNFVNGTLCPQDFCLCRHLLSWGDVADRRVQTRR